MTGVISLAKGGLRKLRDLFSSSQEAIVVFESQNKTSIPVDQINLIISGLSRLPDIETVHLLGVQQSRNLNFNSNSILDFGTQMMLWAIIHLPSAQFKEFSE